MQKFDDTQLNSLATRMLNDFDSHNPGTVFADGLRLDVEGAWRVQGAVARLREARGEKVTGYKIGCVCSVNQTTMGLTHPVWGRLWSTEQYEDGVTLRKSDFANLAIEAEFAITINRDIEPSDAGAQTVANAVDTVFPVLELHNLIMRGDSPHGHELIANNAIHAGVVRGKGVTGSAALTETDLALVYDGATVDSWDGIRWPYDVLASIAWLAQRLAGEGKRLAKGDTILTSALGPPIPIEGARRVDVTSSGFGNVGATFV